MSLSPANASWDRAGACPALGLLSWDDAWALLGRAAASPDPAALRSFSPCAGSLLRQGLSGTNRLREPADWLFGLFSRSCQEGPDPALGRFVSWVCALPARQRSGAFSRKSLRGFDLLRMCLSYGLSEQALLLARSGALAARSGIDPLTPIKRSPADLLLSEMLFSRSAREAPQSVELWSLYLASPCWAELGDSGRAAALRSARAHPAAWVALAASPAPKAPGFAAEILLPSAPWARKGASWIGSPMDDPSALSENIRLALSLGWVSPRQASAYLRRKSRDLLVASALERFLLERRAPSSKKKPSRRKSL